MGAINSSIPGADGVSAAEPGAADQHGRDGQSQGQFAYALSGIDPEQVYASAGKLMRQAVRSIPDFCLSTPIFSITRRIVQVNILRDQAKLYGVSETRILTLLHNAYSQNYTYLIKKPNDQYQVILEVADTDRVRSAGSEPAVHQERRRAAHGAAARGDQLAVDRWGRRP